MNCRMTVLQTVALPLGYITILDCLEWKGRKRLLPPFRRAELHVGAGDEARTRYLHLGKVALYQMSYSRRNPVNTRGGASGRNRTNDTRIFSPLLYHLSYRGI